MMLCSQRLVHASCRGGAIALETQRHTEPHLHASYARCGEPMALVTANARSVPQIPSATSRRRGTVRKPSAQSFRTSRRTRLNKFTGQGTHIHACTVEPTYPAAPCMLPVHMCPSCCRRRTGLRLCCVCRQCSSRSVRAVHGVLFHSQGSKRSSHPLPFTLHQSRFTPRDKGFLRSTGICVSLYMKQEPRTRRQRRGPGARPVHPPVFLGLCCTCPPQTPKASGLTS